MDQDEVRRVSEHICDWLDDHAGFSFNALCRTIGADSGNMQRYRKDRCFLEKHLGLIEAELVKVREYVPMLVNEKAVGENQYDGFKGKSFTQEAYDAGLPVQIGDDVVQKGVDVSLFDRPEFFSGKHSSPVIRLIESVQADHTEAVGEMKGFDYLPKGAFNVENGSVVAAGAAFFGPDGKKTGCQLQDILKDVDLVIYPDENASGLHPEQDRFPGRLVDEGIIEYRLRMAEKK